MRTRFALTATAAAVVAALLAPTAALAQADTSTTTPSARGARRAEVKSQAVDEMKTRCLSQIDRRQNALSAEKTRLQNAKFVTDAHQSALESINEQTSSGLATLADKIQGESDFNQLRVECRQIVDNFRVFALVRPRTRLVLASDRELAAVTKLTAIADRVQSAIDKAKANGKDTTQAEADLATMRSAIASAKSHADGVYDAVIHLTPADYNANHEVLTPPRTNVRSARDSLKQAVASGRAARKSLQAGGPGTTRPNS